jgi:hypothetical protein
VGSQRSGMLAALALLGLAMTMRRRRGSKKEGEAQ